VVDPGFLDGIYAYSFFGAGSERRGMKFLRNDCNFNYFETMRYPEHSTINGAVIAQLV
jgi:hypothetical protein